MTNQAEPIWNSLEIAKFVVSILTPLLLLILSLWTSRILKRLEATQWANQKIIEKRLDIFDAIAPLLNDLLCYFAFVGNWKELTPLQIIETKRMLDKKMHINSPLFSEEFFILYLEFMKLCFKTYTGMGRDAKIRASAKFYQPYTTIGWEESWNDMFTEENFPKDIRSAYQELMARFTFELGIGLRPTHKRMRTIK